MTAHQLAHKLLAMPDVLVTVRGYEGGVDSVESVEEPKELALNCNSEWYYGKHEYTAEYKPFDDKVKVQAIHIG
jgi:succinyl-CoA synthetase beta subunit